jgi:hypothetical protein
MNQENKNSSKPIKFSGGSTRKFTPSAIPLKQKKKQNSSSKRLSEEINSELEAAAV